MTSREEAIQKLKDYWGVDKFTFLAKFQLAKNKGDTLKESSFGFFNELQLNKKQLFLPPLENENDALKPTQFNENMSIYRAGKDLSWETRPTISANDTLQLRMWRMQNANYQLRIDVSNFKLPNGSTAILQDAFLNQETPISLTGTTFVDFAVTSNAASSGERFRIIFRPSVITSVDLVNGNKGFGIYPNPVMKGGNIQLEFQNKAAGNYMITVYSVSGERVQHNIVWHAGGTGVQVIGLQERITSGQYLVEVLGEKGEKVILKLSVQ